MTWSEFLNSILNDKIMKNFATRGVCLLFSFALLALFLFESCQKEEVQTHKDDISTISTNWKATPDDDLRLFSKLLAKSQKQEMVRNFLDSWFKKDQFGETMVFFMQVKDQIVYDNKTFLAILEDEMKTLNVASLRTDYFADLIALYPNLGFSIYTGADNISIASFEYTSSVKVVPETYNFRKAEEMFENGYDENLNEKLFSNNEAPNEPVIIVQNSSEWVILNSSTMKPLDGSNAIVTPAGVMDICDELVIQLQNNYELIGIAVESGASYGDIGVLFVSWIELLDLWRESCQDEDDGEDNSGGGDTDPDDEVCDRDDRSNDEHIVRVKVVHSQLKQFCKWGRKWCRIEVRQLMATNPENLTLTSYPLKYINRERSCLKDTEWCNIGLDMYPFLFLEGEHGHIYSLNFIGKHHNPDGEQSINLSLAPTVKFKTPETETSVSGIGATFGATFANNDINLGGDIVEYCDPANNDGTIYTSGSIDFRIKEVE